MLNPKILTQKDFIGTHGLWHGINLKHVCSIFSNEKLEARTTQRFFPKGQTLKDNHPDYQDSHYVKGWSTTRDRDYAFSWGSIVVLLDEEKIRQDFKVKPIAWNYTIPSAYYFKKEREEFIVSNYMHQTFDEIKSEFDKLSEEIEDDKEWRNFLETHCDNEGFIGYWKRKGLREIPFSKYLKGIYADAFLLTLDDVKELDLIVKHPLFKGFYSSDDARLRLEKSTPPRKNHF